MIIIIIIIIIILIVTITIIIIFIIIIIILINILIIKKKVYDRLDEEIKSISSTTPLIEEKIAIEEELLEKVRKEQREVDELVRRAQERQQNAEERNIQAINKARRDREEMEAELAQCRRELNKSK